MRRLSFVCAVVVATVPGEPAPGGEPGRAPIVDATALVFGRVDADATGPLAGALVLDWDRRLLLTRSRGVPDKPSAVFPAYSDSWDLLTDPADYLTLWRRAERWNAEVLHRDRDRDLAVLRLDRVLPWRAEPAELARQGPDAGTAVRSLTEVRPPGKAARYWGTAEGKVMAAGKAAPVSVATTIALSSSDLGWPLFGAAGQVLGVGGSPWPKPRPGDPASGWLDVSEVRAFLADKKVPFRPTAEEVPLRLTLTAKAQVVKAGQAPTLVLTVKNQGDRAERLRNGTKPHLQPVWFHLTVWRDGKPVPRDGRLINPSTGDPDSFIALKPGARVEFELSRFNVTVADLPPGRYQGRIQFWTQPAEGEWTRHVSPPAEFVVEK